MKKTTVDGDIVFTGHTLRCPMCNHWIVKATGLFGKLILVDGEITCDNCGTKITFGDQERLAALTEEAQEAATDEPEG